MQATGGPPPESTSRFFRLHAFEILIFVIMAVLFAMCLTAAPLIAEGGAPRRAPRAP